jgi:hypothetical protein
MSTFVFDVTFAPPPVIDVEFPAPTVIDVEFVGVALPGTGGGDLPSGVPGDEGKAVTFAGPGGSDYELTDIEGAVAADIAAAVAAHSADTSDVHGITNTAALETTAGAQAKADAAQAAAEAASDPAGTTAAHAALTNNPHTVTKAQVGLGNVTDVDHAAALQAHLDDASDAHDASSVSLADAGGYTTATDVEAIIAEVLAGWHTVASITRVTGRAPRHWRDGPRRSGPSRPGTGRGLRLR